MERILESDVVTGDIVASSFDYAKHDLMSLADALWQGTRFLPPVPNGPVAPEGNSLQFWMSKINYALGSDGVVLVYTQNRPRADNGNILGGYVALKNYGQSRYEEIGYHFAWEPERLLSRAIQAARDAVQEKAPGWPVVRRVVSYILV